MPTPDPTNNRPGPNAPAERERRRRAEDVAAAAAAFRPGAVNLGTPAGLLPDVDDGTGTGPKPAPRRVDPSTGLPMPEEDDEEAEVPTLQPALGAPSATLLLQRAAHFLTRMERPALPTERVPFTTHPVFPRPSHWPDRPGLNGAPGPGALHPGALPFLGGLAEGGSAEDYANALGFESYTAWALTDSEGAPTFHAGTVTAEHFPASMSDGFVYAGGWDTDDGEAAAVYVRPTNGWAAVLLAASLATVSAGVTDVAAPAEAPAVTMGEGRVDSFDLPPFMSAAIVERDAAPAPFAVEGAALSEALRAKAFNLGARAHSEGLGLGHAYELNTVASRLAWRAGWADAAAKAAAKAAAAE